VAAAAEVPPAAAAAAAAASVVAAAGVAVAELAAPDLQPVAIAIGEAWVNEIVYALRSADRDVIGAWPGTLREARMRVRVVVRRKLELAKIEELAHVAYLAARRGWQQVSDPDPEP
jgi:hypothetical protein